jgi:hypothetical protein
MRAIMLVRLRRAGADLPFADPRGYHGVALEGWFWRFTQPSGPEPAVVVAIAAVCRRTDGQRWGMAALGAHPSGEVSWATSEDIATDPRSADVRIGELLHATDAGLRVDLGAAARLDVALTERHPFRVRLFGGVGAAHAVPGLSQYWHPHLLGASVSGSAMLGSQRVELAGATAYAEKNWGAGGMPDAWWWGQAHVGDDRTCVAFAGGPAGLGPLRVKGTALVVGEDRWVAPIHPLRVAVDERRWHLVAHGVRGRVEVEGTLNGAAPVALPVPLPGDGRVLADHSPQHLAGTLRVEVRRRGRVQLAAETDLAGLELGSGARLRAAS